MHTRSCNANSVLDALIIDATLLRSCDKGVSTAGSAMASIRHFQSELISPR